jgi:hypothetical protein
MGRWGRECLFTDFKLDVVRGLACLFDLEDQRDQTNGSPLATSSIILETRRHVSDFN